MIRDYVRKYYLAQERNCAEAIFLAANEALQLGLTEEDAKLVSAFGGGMGCGSTCGALAGAMAVLGKVRVQGSAHETEGFKESCAAMIETFEARLGGTFCSDLKPRYHTEEERCVQTVLLAAEVLESHLAAGHPSRQTSRGNPHP